jgi:exodeoxyribonuclease VII large subunit
VEEAERQLEEAARLLARAALDRLAAEREMVGACRERLLAVAAGVGEKRSRLVEAARVLAVLSGHQLARGRDRLSRAAGGLGAAPARTLRRRGRDRRELGARLVRAARAELRRLGERCTGLQRVAAQLAPERVLARGFSITRTAAGELLRRPAQTTPGARIITVLAGGTLTSRVEPATTEEGSGAP